MLIPGESEDGIELMADVAANMIGRGNARRAARRVFGALQDQRLNQQLVLCVFDEVGCAIQLC